MPEPAQEPVLRQGRHELRFLRNRLFGFEHEIAPGARRVPRVQLQVGHRKVALPQVPRSAAEVLGRNQLFEQSVRQRLAGFVVLADASEHFPVVAKVLLRDTKESVSRSNRVLRKQSEVVVLSGTSTGNQGGGLW